MMERGRDMCGRKEYKMSEHVLQSQDLKDYSRPNKGGFLKNAGRNKVGERSECNISAFNVSCG